MGLNSDQTQNTFQTTDAEPVIVISYSWPVNATGIVQVRVIGKDLNGNAIVAEYRYGVKRASGNCSIVGEPTTVMLQKDQALSEAGIAVNTNGASFSVDVFGVKETVIEWAAKLDILYLNP
jgi:hypothetical protein